MNADLIVWPGGEHPFRLALAQLEGLQKATDCGPEWLLMKLRSGQWLATELFEVLRWGLIGGGMDAGAAKKAVGDSFDRHPMIAFKVPAMSVLMSGLYGPADDPVGKPSLAGETTPSAESEDAGSSAPSTESEPRQVSRRKRSAR